ncbi:MAG: hypothetical protein FJ118_12355 [Deltaproteobacteria bacterium]|nr:hypothetical protein [Deltaproteobacteria bacterium]
MGMSSQAMHLDSKSERLLRKLIFEEMAFVALIKGVYDLRFPRHSKEIAVSELWTVARARVLEGLCDPTL